MKVPDSGMPEEAYWNSLFDVPSIVEWLELAGLAGPVVEIGSGYGTFTIPVARQISSVLHAFDIDAGMISVAQAHARRNAIPNVEFHHQDVAEEGTALPENSVGLVLLFNILHSDQRPLFLREAERILTPSGRAAIIHWRKDIATPRGPLLSLRPNREMILADLEGLDLHPLGEGRALEPFHWGIQLIKGEGRNR
jgi:SAM-dependent methyltransferase